MSLVLVIAVVGVAGHVAAGRQRSGFARNSPVTPLAAASALGPSVVAHYRTQAGGALSAALDRLTRPPRAGRIHYYAHGVFHTRTPDCWRCDVAPGLIAADLAYAFPSQRRYREIAVATFNALIRDHTYRDGSFGPPEPGETGNLISTEMVLQYLGVADLALHRWLDAATRRRWASALLRAGEWLEPQLVYYVNGNINLGLTLNMYLVYRATGDPAFLSAYNRSYDFTLHPSGERWPGFGLKFLKRARDHRAEPKAGYLAETGTGAPGFDPHYTIVQSQVAATLYAVSRQPRVLRLLSLITNALLTRTDRRTDFITTTGGSRRPAPSQSYLESPCLPLLAFAGHRTGLLGLVKTQVNEIGLSFPAYAVRPTDQNGPMGGFSTVLLVLPPAK